jgi:SAM-dependent methyltransferase
MRGELKHAFEGSDGPSCSLSSDQFFDVLRYTTERADADRHYGSAEIRPPGESLSDSGQNNATPEAVTTNIVMQKVPIYKPGLWENSKGKKLVFDRVSDALGEFKRGHPERIWRRFTGNIPEKELYRFFNKARLEPGTYLDLGAGWGNFAQVLGDLTNWHKDTKIYAIDINLDYVNMLKERFDQQEKVTVLHGDYTKEGYFEELEKEIGTSKVDGILFANTLHFHEPEVRVRVLKDARSIIRPGGILKAVEYRTYKDHGPDENPYPLPPGQMEIELEMAGYKEIKHLRQLPSKEMYSMYSVLARVPAESNQ